MFAQETAASALARPLSAAEQQWLAAHSLIGIVVRLTPEAAALAKAESAHCVFGTDLRSRQHWPPGQVLLPTGSVSSLSRGARYMG